MPSQLITTREDRCLTLSISDPATRNTLSPQVYLAAIEALNNADADTSISAVILRGDGEHFCAGGDLGRIESARQQPASAQHAAIAAFHQLIEVMRAFPKPIIAAVEGFAAGGGMSLALACDLIVAAEDARFVMSYGRVGLSPDGGGSWQLAQALPRALALELIWLAEPVSAPRLQALGLVNRLSPPGQAWTQAHQLARQLAQKAPNAIAAAKGLVHRAASQTLTAHLLDESQCFVDTLFHDNAGEGLAAFRAKRPPDFN
jgi:enoyl-CoA hydratase/carnithine racemase